MADKTIFVTGGAGYVGSHVCKALSENGFLPVAVDNLSRGHAALVRFGPLEKADLLDRKRLKTLFEQYQPAAVVHCAGYIAVGESVKDPALYYEQNVIATLQLLAAMKDSGIMRIIFSSSCAVHGSPTDIPIRETMPRLPISPYGRNKMMMEQAIEDYHSAYGLQYMILRYFNACGADAGGEIGECHEPETHLIPLVIQAATGGNALSVFGVDYPTPDGTAIRDYIHVTDIADAHVVALQKILNVGESQVVNIGVGVGYSVKQVIETVERCLDRAVPLKQCARREGDSPVLLADTTKMRSLLEFIPKHSSLENIILTAAAWEKKRKNSVVGDDDASRI